MSEGPIARATGFVDSDSERIYYEVHGEGPALVLCHGAGGNHSVWFQQVPVFAREFRVVSWDQRGFGRSTNRAGEPGPASAVRDLERLLDRLGLERVDLVAQSMGGWAALGVALAHPERVRSLVLADTIGGIYTPEIEEAFDGFLRRAAAMGPPESLPLGRHPALGPRLLEREPALAFLYQELSSLAEPPPREVGVLLRAARQDPAALAALALPVLFVVGSADPIFPPHAIRAAAAQLKDARVIEIADAGHSPYFERAGSWNEVVLDFVRAHRATASAKRAQRGEAERSRRPGFAGPSRTD